MTLRLIIIKCLGYKLWLIPWLALNLFKHLIYSMSTTWLAASPSVPPHFFLLVSSMSGGAPLPDGLHKSPLLISHLISLPPISCLSSLTAGWLFYWQVMLRLSVHLITSKATSITPHVLVETSISLTWALPWLAAQVWVKYTTAVRGPCRRRQEKLIALWCIREAWV